MVSTLPVVEQFHSIQGEGAHVGRSAFFIRLAKCNVGCSWCDTKHSWSEANYHQKDVVHLANAVAEARQKGATFVVITGGEPLHHNLDPLCKAIREITKNKTQAPIPIHLETSGVDTISGNPNWITLSPKRHAQPKLEVLEECKELKIIIHEQKDIVFAESIANKTKEFKRPLLFLQPGWESDTGKKLAFEYVKNNPNWRLSMQTHKWLGVD